VAFTYLKVKSAKFLCILPVVLVLLFWSCYFGLGLKNLVLFTSLQFNNGNASPMMCSGGLLTVREGIPTRSPPNGRLRGVEHSEFT